MTIYERIKKLRENLGMSQQELAEKVGFKTASAVNKIELGLRDINQTKIIAFSKALNVTPAYLMGWDNNENISLTQNIIPIPRMSKVPLLGTIACGEPILADENIEDYINMPNDIKGDFALKCKGDSMINARILDGDIVYIRQQARVEHGEIGAVLIDNEATLKRVYYYPQKNTLILKAENTAYEDLIFTNEELNNIKIIGKAVGFYSFMC